MTLNASTSKRQNGKITRWNHKYSQLPSVLSNEAKQTYNLIMRLFIDKVTCGALRLPLIVGEMT